MGLFGLLNYENYIVNNIIHSDYARNNLILALSYTITGLVRFHLNIIICSLFYWNNRFDLIFPILVTVILSMASDVLFKYVETHKPKYEQLVDHVMNNYSKENFSRWKRYFLISICSYVLLALLFVQIDNYFIFVSTVQALIGIVICDLIEHKMPHKLYIKLMNWWNRPLVKKQFKLSQQSLIIDNYISRPPMKLPTDNEINKSSKDNQINELSKDDEITNLSKDVRMFDLTNKHSQSDLVITDIPYKPPTPPTMIRKSILNDDQNVNILC